MVLFLRRATKLTAYTLNIYHKTLCHEFESHILIPFSLFPWMFSNPHDIQSCRKHDWIMFPTWFSHVGNTRGKQTRFDFIHRNNRRNLLLDSELALGWSTVMSLVSQLTSLYTNGILRCVNNKKANYRVLNWKIALRGNV